MQYLVLFIGGGLGALLRYAFASLNDASSFPTGTFLANIIGAFLMGWLGTLSVQYFKTHPHIKKGITTGFIGAFTTFSTFQFELVTFWTAQQYGLLFSYAFSSYILGLLLCYAGVKLGGHK